jgi:hypothetical protein
MLWRERGCVLSYVLDASLFLLRRAIASLGKPVLSCWQCRAMNMGAFAMQGEEAAFAVDELIQPAAVIPSHVNDAATEGGIVRAGTKTKQFIELVKKSRVHVPRSGHKLEFTGDAKCVTVANIVSRLTLRFRPIAKSAG